MQEIKEYLLSLEPDLRDKVLLLAAKKHVGITADDDSGCSGCTPTTKNGACYDINGVCTWVPDLGPEPN